MSMANKDAIDIITPVIIKSIVTDDLIESLKDRIEYSLETLTQKMHQLDYQKQYLEMQKNKGEKAQDSTYNKIKQVEDDIKLQYQRIKDQETQINSWELGKEVIMAQKESIHRYSVGDAYNEDKAHEIIIKDGIIQEIRRS